MKKLFKFLFTFLVLFIFISCGQDDDPVINDIALEKSYYCYQYPVYGWTEARQILETVQGYTYYSQNQCFQKDVWYEYQVVVPPLDPNHYPCGYKVIPTNIQLVYNIFYQSPFYSDDCADVKGFTYQIDNGSGWSSPVTINYGFNETCAQKQRRIVIANLTTSNFQGGNIFKFKVKFKGSWRTFVDRASGGIATSYSAGSISPISGSFSNPGTIQSSYCQ